MEIKITLQKTTVKPDGEKIVRDRFPILVDVDYEVSGRYRPATLYDPPESPDLYYEILGAWMVHGDRERELSEGMIEEYLTTDSVWEQITEAIWNYLDRHSRDYIDD